MEVWEVSRGAGRCPEAAGQALGPGGGPAEAVRVAAGEETTAAAEVSVPSLAHSWSSVGHRLGCWNTAGGSGGPGVLPLPRLLGAPTARDGNALT